MIEAGTVVLMPFEARIAGANLCGIRRESVGTVGACSTAVGGVARERGYNVVATTMRG